ncbi:hypothetical protein [Litoribacillus peritrichatus]|uniref:Phosphatidylinositol diacylglycerol-lyase n=1 Tax=Litoribacillus peritrichatus TaxID=718191 RepID=A0ABP7MX66_9GAMM
MSLHSNLMAITIAVATSLSLPVWAETKQEWGERVITFQNTIDQDAPLAETTFPGTHNSFANNSDDDYMNEALNQARSIIDQQNRGVRSIGLDLHWSNDKVRMCHNNLSWSPCIENFTGQRRFRAYLKDLANWVESNPDQVVLIHIDDVDDKAGKIDDEIKDYIAEHVMRTDSGVTTHGNYGGNGCTELPVDTLTKSKVLAADKNIIFWSNNKCKDKSTFNDYVFYAGDEVDDVGEPGDLDTYGTAQTTLHRTKDSTTKGTTGSSSPKLKPSTIESFLDAGLNIFEVYGYSATGSDWKSKGEYPVAAADMVWSWDYNDSDGNGTYEPDGSGNCAYIDPTNRRMRDANCTISKYAACRRLVEDNTGTRAYNDYIVTSIPTSFTNAEAQCNADGSGEYYFATPRNKVELNALLNVIDDQELTQNDVWVNYQKDTNGNWVTDIGEADAEMKASCDAGSNANVCGVIDQYLSKIQ